MAGWEANTPRGQLPLLHRSLSVIVLVLIGAAQTTVPAHAAPNGRPASGDTLSLQLANGPSFTYAGQSGGTPAPKFTATLVLAAAPTANRFMQVNVSIAGQSFGNVDNPSVSQDKLTYTFTIDTAGTAVAGGSHTATASYSNPDTHTTTHSNAVSFTIAKANPQVQCIIANNTYLTDPGQTVNFQMSFSGENPNAPVDWQNSTYSITFHGNAVSHTFTPPL